MRYGYHKGNIFWFRFKDPSPLIDRAIQINVKLSYFSSAQIQIIAIVFRQNNLQLGHPAILAHEHT